MADEKTEQLKFGPEVEKSISEATSPEQIRDIAAAQPRDEKGKFTAATSKVEEPEKKEEPTVYKDSFLIGGKEVEFTGNSEGDLLKQVKVAQQAYEMGKAKPEEKKEDPKPAVTAEELAALQLKMAAGDPKAMEEYLEKSGFMDRYLEKKGIKPEEIKQVLQDNASAKVVKDWDGAVKDFLAESDWPGGTQNEKLLKYKLAELKDDAGQPLAYSPSKDSLLKAYEALKSENMLFAREEQKTEDRKEAVTVNTTAKKPAAGSTVFGTSQESGTRRTAATNTKDVPQITDDMSPQQIMQIFKDKSAANGQSPDDMLRQAYGAGRA